LKEAGVGRAMDAANCCGAIEDERCTLVTLPPFGLVAGGGFLKFAMEPANLAGRTWL